jgi:selenocysteine lyase/cysteine desulfurase
MKHSDKISSSNSDYKNPNEVKLTRRKWLSRVGLVPFAAAITSHLPSPVFASSVGGTLPARNQFKVKGTFINAAFTHPMSMATAEALKAYADRRLTDIRIADEMMDANRTEALKLFAKLINANPEELAWVPSTMVGENFIVAGLGLPGSSQRVVTDAYHFNGSLYLYGQLAKRGLDVQVLIPKENGINLNDLDKAITPNTKLVAISLVSTVNGFQHDLKAVCDLAHSKGALVYADIIQAAGAIPIDVKASGVDFCACSSYKWLMADFGAGFLYVRKDKLPMLNRSQYGYRQIDHFDTHVFPFDSPSDQVYDWTANETVGGYFQVGTLGNGTIAALRESLRYLNETGVDNIQRYRQPLLDKLQEQLPRFGFVPMTPVGSTSPIVSFGYKDAASRLKSKLDAADINISLYANRIRISPSVYNTMADVEKLIDVVSK